jgi:hypothetical protein
MPDQRRIRRLGITSAAISTGAVALLVGAAGPADAASSSCPVGHDPASTLKSIQCQLRQAAQNWQNQINKLTHPQQPTAPQTGDNAQHPQPPAKASPSKPQAGAGQPSTPHISNPSVPAGTATPDGVLRPGPGPGVAAPLTAPLPFLGQSPQVAAEASLPGSGAPETHLISPAAATSSASQTSVSPIIVAGVSGLAGAVVALNLSYAARRIRRAR